LQSFSFWLVCASPWVETFEKGQVRGVAQSGSALDWGSRGRRFKSGRPDHFGSRNRRFWWRTPPPKPRGCNARAWLGLALKRFRVLTFAWVAGSLAFGVPYSARAQSIRDAVREHVGEGLESGRDGAPPARPPEKKKKKKPAKAARSPRPPASVSPTPAGSTPSPNVAHADAAGGAAAGQADVARSGANEEKLPKRVFGKNFELDAKVGAGIRGWYPEQYPLVGVDHASFLTWSVDLKAKLFGFLRLHRGYYESNGLKGPRTQGAVVARDVGRLVPKAAWLLGTLGVPISRRWETMVSYEARSFATRARPASPVAIVPRKTSPEADLAQLPRSEQALRFVSGFETLVLGVRHFPDRGNAGLVGDQAGRIPPMYFGVGFTQYSKPYQVNVGGDPLDELLFDGRFRGAGLAYGLATGREIERPFLSLDAQLGLGEVRLLDDLTVNELLPEDWLIGYLQGNVTVGYILPLIRSRPTPLLSGELSAGGATFFYFVIRADEGKSAPALPLNWDLFWAARVSLTLPL
jgi:hypothetical protein